ncbi:MAG: hypothetical protein L0Y44_16380 [Phycisphaerales bacterium]|nr:hypothetical protein [Phycisphaerales bacterium]
MDETRPFSTFKADFPDDSIEQDDEIVVPAGRNIMEAICLQLKQLGHDAQAPSQHSFYGWSSQFAVGQLKVWLVLQFPDPWLLIAEARGNLLSGRKAKADALQKGVEAIAAALAKEPRIGEVCWMTQEAYESSQGAKAPTNETGG